jgi:hypothetical protein
MGGNTGGNKNGNMGGNMGGGSNMNKGNMNKPGNKNM